MKKMHSRPITFQFAGNALLSSEKEEEEEAAEAERIRWKILSSQTPPRLNRKRRRKNIFEKEGALIRSAQQDV